MSLLSVVTGASRGIGKAVSIKLANSGHNVVCIGRNISTINEVRDELPIVKDGQKHFSVSCPDFCEMSDVDSDNVIKEVAQSGSIRHLVHSAGVTGADGVFLKCNLDIIQTTLRINVITPLQLTRSALRYGNMLKEPSSICFIGSVVGTSGNRGQVAYSTSKSALVGAVKSLSKEYSPKLVRTNMVTPGFIDTDMTSGILDIEKNRILANTPLNRFGTPEEVADAVLFALTSEFLTGQTIQLDGGLVL
eukprot:TRINITY_DN11136_c0_g1_i1.p1 TRINITY_DN11136_c0_g1~~TRINITY_DN11136_c0_g1_i1.p1  ORF type:complete len:248 (+),score=37.12 TRINITY_DN11136_c0_g1_i1:54-797(+)